MEITTVNEILFEAISKASKITTKNPQIPVLEYILLDLVDDSTLRVTANNLDILYIQDVFVKTTENTFKKQSICVSGGLIMSYLGLFNKEDQVKIGFSEKSLVFSINNQKSTINGVSATDYPKTLEIQNSLKETSDSEKVTISSDLLIQGIQAVSFAAAVTSIKPELSCVMMSVSNEAVVFVATDAFRLAEKRFSVSNADKSQVRINSANVDGFKQILIPSKIIQDCLKIISPGIELQLSIQKGTLCINIPDSIISLRIISGSYPNYQAIFPKAFVTNIEIFSSDFISGIKASNLFSDEFNYVKLDIQDSSIILNSKNSNVGESVFKKDIKKQGENISQSYNHRYLSDFVNRIKDDLITIDISGKSTPTILRVKNDPSYTYLVMPMNK